MKYQNLLAAPFAFLLSVAVLVPMNCIAATPSPSATPTPGSTPAPSISTRAQLKANYYLSNCPARGAALRALSPPASPVMFWVYVITHYAPYWEDCYAKTIQGLFKEQA